MKIRRFKRSPMFINFIFSRYDSRDNILDWIWWQIIVGFLTFKFPFPWPLSSLSPVFMKKFKNGPSVNSFYFGLDTPAASIHLNFRSLPMSLIVFVSIFSSIKLTMYRSWLITSVAFYKVNPLKESIFSFLTIVEIDLFSIPLKSTGRYLD